MIKIGTVYICKSNSQEYQVLEIIKYKDERSNGWIEIVVYQPLYECEIKKFSRSLTMFSEAFFERK